MADAITASFGLDLRPLQAAALRARAIAGRMASQIGNVLKAGALAGAVALAAGVAITMNGVRKAFDLGGALADVSAQTGLAAGAVLILQKAFENAGISADKLRPAINRMQKAIVDAGNGGTEQQEAFARLGLNFADLQKMNPGQQFQAIQKAISGMSDPAQKAAAAMSIFGKSGAELLSVFNDAGAIGTAAKMLGSQAQILNENAQLFDQISDLLGTAGDKLQGFFVGVASGIAPQLLPILQEFNNLDFAKLGAQIGQSFATVIELFKGGKFGEIVGEAFKLAGYIWLENSIAQIKAMGSMIAKVFGAAVGVFDVVTKKEFWTGLLDTLVGIAKNFAATLLDGVALLIDQLAKIPLIGDKISGGAQSVRDTAAEIRGGVSGSGASNPIKDTVDKVVESISDIVSGGLDGSGAQRARDRIAQIFGEASKAAVSTGAAVRAQVAGPAAIASGAPATSPNAASQAHAGYLARQRGSQDPYARFRNFATTGFGARGVQGGSLQPAGYKEAQAAAEAKSKAESERAAKAKTLEQAALDTSKNTGALVTLLEEFNS